MAKKLKRKTSVPSFRVPTVRRQKPTPNVVIDVAEYLRNAAAAETNERRRRFMVALVQVVRDLSPDEMDKIEPLLVTAIGQRSLGALILALPERV